MFYEMKLLCPQKVGIFANVWIAATLGVKKLTKNQILNTHVIKTCKEIEEMIVTQSHRPKKRLSLRLSITLINGITKIHMYQVISLQNDVLSFFSLSYVTKPVKKSDETFKRPRAVQTKRKPRPKQLPEAPEQQEEQIRIPPGSSIRHASDICYRYSAADEEAKRVKEFGKAPVEWADEQFIQIIENYPDHERIQTSALVHAEGRTVAEVPERIEEEITERREQQGREDAVQITETPRKKTREEDRIDVIETPQSKRQRQEQDEITEAETPRKKKQREDDQAVEVETPRKRRRLFADTDKSETTKASPIKNIRGKLIKFKKYPTTKYINRIEAYGNELFDKWTFDNVIPNLVVKERKNPCEVNFRYLISEFFKHESEFIRPGGQADRRPLTGTKSSTQDKGSVPKPPSQRRRTTPTPIVEGGHGQVAPDERLPAIIVSSPQSGQIVPVIVHQPHDFQQVEKSVERVSAEAMDEAVPQQPPVDEPVPQQPPVDEPEHARPLERTRESSQESSSTEKRLKTEEERQKILARAILKWNEKEMGEITIDKICPKPINRKNIAKTFSDLLHLSKMGYVKLNSQENSLELGTIEKGRKLLRN